MKQRLYRQESPTLPSSLVFATKPYEGRSRKLGSLVVAIAITELSVRGYGSNYATGDSAHQPHQQVALMLLPSDNTGSICPLILL
jgi:hypothetical protein